MILQSLHALYARLKDDPAYEVAPPGYSLQKISFKVVLHPDGRLFEIQGNLHEGRARLHRVLGYTKPPGSGLNPCTLWDNTGYMLGFKPDDPDPDRSRETFEAFRAKHLELERLVSAPEFSAVCRFLEKWNPARAPEYPVLAETKAGFGVFQRLGQPGFVHEAPTIETWWKAHFTADEEHGPEAQCLLSGRRGPTARLHAKIKMPSGDATLVCFDKDAFCSYGKEQGQNAPVGEDAAFAYGAALNSMLAGPKTRKHRMQLADATVAFWTDKPSLVEDVFAQFAERGADMTPRPGEVQDPSRLRELEVFLAALRQGLDKSGDLAAEASRTAFYLLGLSPNQGRVAVRFFLHGSVRDLIDHLRQHHVDMGIEQESHRPGPEFPPTWLLLRQTARESKDIAPNLTAPLLRAVMTGSRYPESLLAAVVRRIRADREINYLRACIIKGCLVRNHEKEIAMSLDLDKADPAYRLGRLFAVLEKTQEDALGGVNASIRDRFYSSASATPASVFPRLLRTYQHHLGRLEGGRKVNREKLVQEIMDPLNSFPSHLGLGDQGLFAIGFYHQRQAFFRKPAAESTQEECKGE